MNFLNQYRGHLICAGLGILVGVFGVLWLKGSKPKTILPNPVVDTPTPVQPKFDDTLTMVRRVYRLGGSIGIAKPTAPEATPPETVYQQPSPCKPFSLHLSSKPTSLSSVLDSVVVDYFYPSGMHTFEYYNRPSQAAPGTYIPRMTNLLSTGFEIGYIRWDNNLYANAYIRLRISGLNLKSGYHHQTRQQLSWFVSVGKEWRLF